MIHLPLFHREPSDYDSDSDLAAWEPYAAALRELPIPDRPRDFVLSAQMAAKLRPAHRRSRSGRAVLVPLAAVLVVGVILPRLFLPASTSTSFSAPAVIAPERVSSVPNSGKVAGASSAFDANGPCQAALNAAGSGESVPPPSPSSAPLVILPSPSPTTSPGQGLIATPTSAPVECYSAAP